MVFFLIGVGLFSEAQAEDNGVLIRLGGEVVSSEQIQQTNPSTATRISIDLVQADIHSVIRLFATYTGHNFIVSDGVEGKVTVTLNQVPWDEALQAVLLSQGLMAIPVGDVTVIGK